MDFSFGAGFASVPLILICGTEMDITEWPQNIHEYHRMLATAQANAIKLEEMAKMTKTNAAEQDNQITDNSKTTKKEGEE